MTLTVLASVSLFALVSTARPLRRAEEELLAYVTFSWSLTRSTEVVSLGITSPLIIMKLYEQSWSRAQSASDLTT